MVYAFSSRYYLVIWCRYIAFKPTKCSYLLLSTFICNEYLSVDKIHVVENLWIRTILVPLHLLYWIERYEPDNSQYFYHPWLRLSFPSVEFQSASIYFCQCFLLKAFWAYWGIGKKEKLPDWGIGKNEKLWERRRYFLFTNFKTTSP